MQRVRFKREKKRTHLNQLLRQPKTRPILLLLREVKRAALPEPRKPHIFEDPVQHGGRALERAGEPGIGRERLQQRVRGLERGRRLAVPQDVVEEGDDGGASGTDTYVVSKMNWKQ